MSIKPYVFTFFPLFDRKFHSQIIMRLVNKKVIAFVFCVFIQLAFTCLKLTMENLTMCEICSELYIKTPDRRHWRRFSVFIVNFEQISHILVLPLLTLNEINAGWVFKYFFSLGRCSVIGGGGN